MLPRFIPFSGLFFTSCSVGSAVSFPLYSLAVTLSLLFVVGCALHDPSVAAQSRDSSLVNA